MTSFGYDDRAGELPLLVTYPTTGGARGAAAAKSAVTAEGSRIVRELPVIGALAIHADRESRASLWGSLTRGTANERSLRPGVEKIWLDGKRRTSLDHSVPQIGAPTAWKAGFDGTGVTVAVLDTGIDATHPDLTGQIAGSENFTTEPDADDKVGHGTHVASTIAGTRRCLRRQVPRGRARREAAQRQGLRRGRLRRVARSSPAWSGPPRRAPRWST